MRKSFNLIVSFFFLASVFSKNNIVDGKGKYEGGLEVLLFEDIPVSVASLTERNEFAAPAVLTLITKQEIENSGARDLNDILVMVPGFVQASEVQGTTSYGIRGLWGNEGKILVMIDGIKINEMLYGNPIFGGSKFTDYIERIEIIRGPGSALYGGFAELAVINIITKSANMQGTSISVMNGQMSDTYGHRTINIHSDHTIRGTNISVNAAIGSGNTSDRNFIVYNDQVSPIDFNGNNSWFTNLEINHDNFDMKFIGNSCITKSALMGGWDDALGVYSPCQNNPLNTKFESYFWDAKYKFLLQDNFSITPRLTYSQFNTWSNDNDFALENNYYYSYPSHQTTFNVTAQYDLSENMNFVFGTEYSNDNAKSKAPTLPFSDGSREVNYNKQSFFGEYLAITQLIDMTIGARYDKHSHSGNAFVPRLALVKSLNNLYFKVLANRAYRTPTILNIDYTSNIKPEFTTSLEAEVGYKFENNILLSVNIFDTRMKDIIVYDNSIGVYHNYKKSGTQGLEMNCKANKPWGYMNFCYSFYKATENDVPLYRSYNEEGELNKSVLLGFPSHKVTLSANRDVTDKISVNPSVLYMSNRYVTYWSDASGGTVNKILEPVIVANLNFRMLFVDKKWEVNVGVYNIFDTTYDIAPGYYNYHRETPGFSREFVTKVSYKF